ncbi:MAG: hypothetical protein CSA26_09595 [Desulfobacterales bacterium]|nr:MAG: hypothetical protein CSA26_09595 [Desulfobacterales bacterium]
MIRKLLLAILVFLCAFVVLLSVLLVTPAGVKLAVFVTPMVSGGMVRLAAGEGAFWGDWYLKDIMVETPAASVSIAEIRCQWKPEKLANGVLHIGAIGIDDLDVLLKSEKADSVATADYKPKLPEVILPLSILLGTLTITDGVVRNETDEAGQTDAPPLFECNRFTISVDGKKDILQIHHLQLDSSFFSGAMTGMITMSGDWPVRLGGTWWTELKKKERLDGHFSIVGSVGRPDFIIDLKKPFPASLTGTVRDLLEEPFWKIELGAEQLDLRTLSDDFPEGRSDLSFTSSGTLQDYRASLELVTPLPTHSTLHGRMSVQGNASGLADISGNVSAGDSEVALQGQLDWQEGVAWELKAVINDMDPSLYPGAGKGSVNGELITSGSLKDRELAYDVGLKGLSASMDPPYPSVTDGEITIEGNRDGVHLFTAHLGAGNGELDIDGDLAWEDGIRWHGTLVFSSIDPSVFGPIPQGRLDGRIVSDGSFLEKELVVHGGIDALTGELAGRPLTGSGTIVVEDGQLVVREIQVDNHLNSLKIDGEIGERLNLSFSFNGRELHSLLTELDGFAVLDGTITGTREKPLVQLESLVRDLSFRDYSIKKLNGAIAVVPTASGQLNAECSVSEIRGGEYHVTEGMVAVRGTIDNHSGALKISSDVGALDAHFSGGLVDWKAWNGIIDGVAARHSLYGSWIQQGSAQLNAGPGLLSISEFCSASAKNKICVGGTWRGPDSWSVAVSDFTFSLATVHNWRLIDQEIEGMLTGMFRADGTGTVVTDLAATITVPQFRINREKEAPYPDVSWNDTRVVLSLTETLLKASVDTSLADGSFASGQLRIYDFGDLAHPLTALPLSGELEVEIKDLSPLTALTDDFIRPSGFLSADLLLSGTVGQPRLDGHLDLLDGGLEMTPLGIVLNDLSADISGLDDGFQLNLTGSSGPGEFRADGRVSFGGRESWHGDFHLSGKEVKLLDQSEIRLLADPDIDLVVGGAGGMVRGSVFIPKARIKPEEMEGSDSASGDVVFNEDDEAESSWPFLIDLAVALGDDVHIDGYGVTGNLKGGVQVYRGANGIITGDGVVTLENGLFNRYGRSVEVSRGRILFDGPIDTPGLDISASKQIQGEDLEDATIIVGVTVDGPVDDYTVELFSNPLMDESEIFAYLVLGKSSASGDSESSLLRTAADSLGFGLTDELLGPMGTLLSVDDIRFEGSGLDHDTSLVVGKQLTDDLSIKYDFNLFEGIGYIKVRYDFGYGFALESRSSSLSNGINLLYSLQR